MMIKNDDVTPDEQVVCCMGASATPVCVCVCECVFGKTRKSASL